MDDQGCPRCKTTKYRNPSLKLMVNVCGHTLLYSGKVKSSTSETHRCRLCYSGVVELGCSGGGVSLLSQEDPVYLPITTPLSGLLTAADEEIGAWSSKQDRCENCVEMLFARGSGSCMQCDTPLRKSNFRVQLFEDATVDKEVEIRKKVMKM
ncbi:hypothetical protein GOODEAATRI_000102 [Goodea atripinnis]|uniref:MAT1 centre domain-containing protein n=1 Tax=Goodea atripinnis TaxID=208336 RepID=A0ABV0P2W3_9TELE